MGELIIIKCPKCGKHFALTQEPLNPSVKVRCLACHQYTPYSELRPVQEPAVEPAEQIEQETIVQQPVPQLPVLRLLTPLSEEYQLKLGRNVIGRSAATSQADIQIGTAQMKHISREHAVVDVKEEMGSYACYFSLFKQTLNDTYVSDKKVSFGDSIRLCHGDRLILPDNAVMEVVIE